MREKQRKNDRVTRFIGFAKPLDKTQNSQIARAYFPHSTLDKNDIQPYKIHTAGYMAYC